MQDRVADVLAQRAALDRGAGAGVVLSILLHAALFGAVIYTAMHAPAPDAAKMVTIQFAKMPAAQPASVAKAAPAARRVEAPRIEEPKPVIREPRPAVEPAPVPPAKNTVPLSPFGRSAKKGAEKPEAAPPPSMAGEPGTSPGTIAAPDIAVGASGVTGLEGGDFPYSLYIQTMQRKIGANWFRPQAAAGATVIIYYRVLRDGTITDAKVQTPSGNGTFDRAALSAVRSASPLNPLPFAYSGTYLGVHLTFR